MGPGAVTGAPGQTLDQAAGRLASTGAFHNGHAPGAGRRGPSAVGEGRAHATPVSRGDQPFWGRDGRISTRLCMARGFVRSRSTTISPTSSGWSAQPAFAVEPRPKSVATLPGIR